MSDAKTDDIDRLQPDRGDVKAATANIHFDEDKKEEKAGEGEKAPPVAAAEKQASEGEDHLEPSKEPTKPGSQHPVMDSK